MNKILNEQKPHTGQNPKIDNISDGQNFLNSQNPKLGKIQKQKKSQTYKKSQTDKIL